MPGQPGAAAGRTPAAPRLHRLASRPKWVTIAATPFLFSAFFQAPLGMAIDLAAFGVIATAMWMTREGLAAEAAYDARRVARRPAIPRKLFGGILAGLGLGLGAAEPGSIAGAAVIGLAGLALHALAFGADPMRDKGMEGGDSFQRDRATRMIEEGQAHLAEMLSAIAATGDRRLESRVAGFAATAEALFDRVRDNPGDLSVARRYMGVYLMGARDATVKFAALYQRTGDPQTRAAYETFLDDLEKDFSARVDRLLDGDRADLEIEISVLRERLAREGVRARTGPTEPPTLTSDDARTMDHLLAPDRDQTSRRR
ncbi:5-bromo-4-chloroindolyl phosphate hydrolysis family protein [Paracoccus sp. EGI L200073]|nr:5-bromo-4-chloroindolyl phosphate hydrolysis family protein [Paracoccus salsus]